MKRILLVCILLAGTVFAQAQFLKKIKDKVNKTIGKDEPKKTEDSAAGSTDSKPEKETVQKVAWCDTIKTDGSNGISYAKVYTASGRADIVYSESALGLAGNASGYRLILSQRMDGKEQFAVVENGKVIETSPKVQQKYLGEANLSGSEETHGDGGSGAMKKYIVADSSTIKVAPTSAKKVTVEKIDDDQAESSVAIMHQTDEYKNMTDAEKKELDATLAKGFAENNSRAGQTFSAPATKGGSFATISGYKLIVKGKTYGKFMIPPALNVSGDELAVFAVGIDEKGAPVMMTQSKKNALDKNRFLGNDGFMLRSVDRRKAVYLEPKKMSQTELEAVSSGKSKLVYNALHSDGAVTQVTDQSGSADFKLTDAGTIVSINATTGEIYADNTRLGQFRLPDGGRLESGSVLIGGTPKNIAYFDGSTGSLNYMDGSVKKLGIIFPRVTTENGKTYLSWFRKCRSDIYIGKFAY